MKKGAFLLMLIPFLSSCGYNRLVSRQEDVNKSWSLLENYCQQRIDLSTRFLNTFKNTGLVKKSLISRLEQERDSASALSFKMNPADLSQGFVTSWEHAQNQLKKGLNEAYNSAEIVGPGMVNNISPGFGKNILSLDKKISEAILDYNEKTLKYNASRQSYKHIFIAEVASFHKKGYFLKSSDSK